MTCAPFSQILSVYLSLCAFNYNSGCTHFLPSATGRCTSLNLDFGHCYYTVYIQDVHVYMYAKPRPFNVLVTQYRSGPVCLI